jgi:hypothetical protein
LRPAPLSFSFSLTRRTRAFKHSEYAWNGQTPSLTSDFVASGVGFGISQGLRNAICAAQLEVGCSGLVARLP